MCTWYVEVCISGGHISADLSKISSRGRGRSDTRQSANSACAGPVDTAWERGGGLA